MSNAQWAVYVPLWCQTKDDLPSDSDEHYPLSPRTPILQTLPASLGLTASASHVVHE
jgi:hypothetical protein